MSSPSVQRDLLGELDEAAQALLDPDAGNRLGEDESGALGMALDVLRSAVSAAEPRLLANDAVSQARRGARRVRTIVHGTPGTEQPIDAVNDLVASASVLRAAAIGESSGPAVIDLFGAARERIGAFAAKVSAREEEVLGSLATLQTEAAELKGRVGALAETAESRLAALESSFSDLQGRMQTALNDQAEAFRSAEVERDGAFERSVEDLASRAEATHAELHDHAEAAMRRIDERVAGIDALAGALAVAGTTDRFAVEAAAQQSAANWWRWGAVVAALVAALAGAAIAFTIDEDSDWRVFTARILATGSLILIAGYAAGQSAQHREREYAARQTELDLAAFGPFIASLDDEDQQTAHVVIADRIFGRLDRDTPPTPSIADEVRARRGTQP